MIDISNAESIAAAIAQMKHKAEPTVAVMESTVTQTAIAVMPKIEEIPQPSANGEFSSPADGAIYMAVVHGKRQTPLSGKAAFLPNWQSTASVDPVQIRAWAAEHPGCNFGSIADDGLIFETDSPEVRKRFNGQFSQTLTIQSSEAKGHRYYLSNDDVEHIAQNATPHGDFSLRKHNAYCVSPGSIHPTTGKQYRVAINAPMVVPTAEEIAFWKSERVEKKNAATIELDQPIPEGQRNSTLASILGKARQTTGANYDVLIALARQHNERCSPPLPDSELQTVAHSIAGYAVKETGGLVFGDTSAQVTAAPVDWRSQFRTVGELEKGNVRMLISGFLPEGTTFIGGLPGEGKTLFALSLAKALTTTDPFLGKFFVEEQIPVIYLIPESSSRAFRARCETFRIPNDEKLFLCRTVSEGATLPLDDTSLFAAVRKLKPVVILDTFIRFSEADDENDAAQNKKIVNDIIALRQAGAVAVIGLHHAKKTIRDKGMSLEAVLRGTGDIAASADAVYGLLRDHLLYNNGAGPNEIEVSCVKPRDFNPPEPFRIAASRRPDKKNGVVLGGTISVIDQYHDFIVVNENTSEQAAADKLNQLVESDPNMSLVELEKATGRTSWNIRQALKNLGWSKSRGGMKGGGAWIKQGPPPFAPGPAQQSGDRISDRHQERSARKPRKPAVVLDLPEQGQNAAKTVN
jgi:hypothetical protein